MYESNELYPIRLCFFLYFIDASGTDGYLYFSRALGQYVEQEARHIPHVMGMARILYLVYWNKARDKHEVRTGSKEIFLA